MPYVMCPICGALMHLNISDPAAWYADRHPYARCGDLVPEPCLSCFGDLVAGDRVVTRRLVNENLTIEPGQRGVLKAISENHEFGSIYVVALNEGRTMTVPRAAIRKLRDNEG